MLEGIVKSFYEPDALPVTQPTAWKHYTRYHGFEI